MNLILQDAVEFQVMDWKTVSDGEGGFDTVLAPGAEFRATISRENEQLAQIAQAITQVVQYKLYTSKSVSLKAKNIIKRLSDQQLFEVLFDNEKQTPGSSSMDLRVTTVKPFQEADAL